MPPTIVHFSTDTLPRVVAGPAGSATLDLVLPFRIDLGVDGADPAPAVVAWQLEVTVDGRSWTGVARTRRLPAGLADTLRGRMARTGAFSFDQLPYYAGLYDEDIRAGRAVYLEGRVPRLRPGAAVTYRLVATLQRGGAEQVVLASPTFTTYAVDPRFTSDEVTRIWTPGAFHAGEAWVLHHRRESGLDQIRIDVADLRTDAWAPERAPLTVSVADTTVDLAAGRYPTLPLVDVAADSVTIAVPHDDGPLPPVHVRYRGGEDVAVDLAARSGVGEARVVFINFAIQGLNDLFAAADDDYEPPRTYTQLTMRDEAASYSSRPGSVENGVGDGYAFTVDAHRRYRIPQMWAMNGGLLGLLAHDCPDDITAMRGDVAAKLLVPVVAGYGAHRLPYYTAATNTDAIRFGTQLLTTLLGGDSLAPGGGARPVYYPDQRLVAGTSEVTDALRAGDVEYLVVDAGKDQGGGQPGAGGNTVVDDVKPPMGAFTDGRWLNWQYLWRDQGSGAKLLFIDRELKDTLFAADNDTADRGKPAPNLRLKFLEMASAPVEHRGNLLVYSDDADKASGNGWFDGGYDPRAANNYRYQAVLSWLATHPWVRVVTTDDLTDDDVVGELNLVRASDPYIEEKWRLDVPLADGHDNGLAYDTWYAAWARTRADWLGETLRDISDRAEQAIARRRADIGDRDDELVLLARLYFTMCLHESQWSKRPRIDPPNEGFDQPENFVAAETLQLRNAHVFLAASVWAQWAAGVAAGRTESHRDDGQVITDVATMERKGFANGQAPPWWRESAAGLQWDHDPLPNVVLYNERALVVIDRNGGRITHLFARVEGRPVSVSGTHKAYQSVEADWATDGGLECDGLLLQNTVCTPNHAYVACDVDAARGTVGARPPNDRGFDFGYPDNFNLYDEVPGDGPEPSATGPSVTFVYGPGTGEQPPASLAELTALLEADRVAKLTGDRGTVLHDVDEFDAFMKTIRLDGPRVHVEYRGTRPGHRVANEFCVDLLAAALHGAQQAVSIDAGARGATIVGRRTYGEEPPSGPTVRVELGDGCDFSATTRAAPRPPTVASLRLHRVMTDNLEIVAPKGGDFDYRIVLP